MRTKGCAGDVCHLVSVSCAGRRAASVAGSAPAGTGRCDPCRIETEAWQGMCSRCFGLASGCTMLGRPVPALVHRAGGRRSPAPIRWRAVAHAAPSSTPAGC